MDGNPPALLTITRSSTLSAGRPQVNSGPMDEPAERDGAASARAASQAKTMNANFAPNWIERPARAHRARSRKLNRPSKRAQASRKDESEIGIGADQLAGRPLRLQLTRAIGKPICRPAEQAD